MDQEPDQHPVLRGAGRVRHLRTVQGRVMSTGDWAFVISVVATGLVALGVLLWREGR